MGFFLSLSLSLLLRDDLPVIKPLAPLPDIFLSFPSKILGFLGFLTLLFFEKQSDKTERFEIETSIERVNGGSNVGRLGVYL